MGEERSLHEGLVELRRRCATIPVEWAPLPVSAASSLAVARVKQEAPKSNLLRVVALKGPWSFELGNRMTGTNNKTISQRRASLCFRHAV
jgi:hypothetical protein